MPPADPTFVALQNALLGRYSIERELGRGGMGTVYLARDIRLDRPVALKLLHPHLAAQAGARQRFLAEARTAARLAHPHIVPIYSVEESGTLVWFVMALVDGETVGARLRRRGALPPEQAERLMREIAWALSYAHAHDVIHRDLTLENVLLDRHTGRALLADFGIAVARDTIESTPTFGTPGFIAPEVIRGESASPETDLYALGVVAYTALAGTAPFTGDTSAQLLAKHLMQPVTAPAVRGASRRLIGAVLRCLAKEASERPADAGQLIGLLDRASEPVAIAPPLHHWFTRWTRIRPIYALAAPVLAMQTWLMVAGYFDSGLRVLLTFALITTILTLTAVPVLAHLGFEAMELRRLRGAGYGVDDIRAAYAHWRQQQVRERAREGLAPLPGRVIFDLTVIGTFVILATFVLIWPNLDRIVDGSELWYVQTTIVGMLSPVYLATLTGVGIGFLIPGHRPRADGWLARATQRFWESRLAGLIVRLSALGQRHTLTATATLHRHTEMVLGLAVDDLWKSIPEATRHDLGDVPALAHMLQRGAAELRDLIERLRDSERELGDNATEVLALAAAREPLERQHRDSVAALERVRLQLLRLVATREPTSELMTHLDAARAVEATLVRDVSAQREVRRLLGRVPARARIVPSPTPSLA